MIFQYGLEPVLIQRILIGFIAILDQEDALISLSMNFSQVSLQSTPKCESSAADFTLKSDISVVCQHVVSQGHRTVVGFITLVAFVWRLSWNSTRTNYKKTVAVEWTLDCKVHWYPKFYHHVILLLWVLFKIPFVWFHTRSVHAFFSTKIFYLIILFIIIYL